MAELRVHDVSKRLGGHLAVDGVSFTVLEGEFFVLLGPSGGGKSTVLRLICGLEQPDSGTITLAERDVTALPPRQRNLGMVFQDYGLYPNMDVFDNIAYGLQARGLPRAEVERRVGEAAQNLGLGEMLRRSVVDLSGGEQQRVALSRALAKDADAYLYDEPLSNLDPKLRFKARHDIIKVHRAKRRPSVYVTHDQDEAFAMGDRIAVMGPGGRLQQVGSSDDLLERPANLFVAGFIGNPPMNLLEGRLEPGQRARVVGEGFEFEVPPRLARAVAALSAEKLVVGIRPDGLTPATGPGGVEGHVSKVEPLIGETEVVLMLPSGKRVLVLLPEQLEPPKTGDLLRVRADPERINLFDLQEGQALHLLF